MAKKKEMLRLKKEEIRRRKEDKKKVRGFIGYKSKTKLNYDWTRKNHIITDINNIRYDLSTMTYFELKKLEKDFSQEYKRLFERLIKHSEKNSSLYDYYLLDSNIVYCGLYLIRIYLNRFNEYKSLNVAYKGSYDFDIEIYNFRNGNKKMINRWLEKNDLKKGYESFNIYSDYDCTGKLSSKSVKAKGTKVIIFKWYDL